MSMYYEKTYKTRKELLQLLEELNEEKLHQKENPEQWTVSENVEHLYLFEKNILIGLQKAIQRKLAVEEKDVNLEKILANRTYKVKAPEGFVPSSHPYTKVELVKLLEQSRANLVAFIEEVDEDSIHRYGFNHRWIGDLTVNQWLQLVGFHEQRHMEQIKEVVGREGK